MSVLIDDEAHRKIYLIFHDDCEYPFSRFMKPGFRHVFAIELQALGWVCIDPNRTDLTCTILPASWDIDIMPKYRDNNPDSTIINLKVYPTKRSNYPRPSLISCVGVCQYLLGIYYPHIFTPYLLYNKIINSNIKHIEVLSNVRTKQRKTRSQSSRIGCGESGR